MGFFQDLFGGGATRARKEKDHWMAQAAQQAQMTQYIAAENQTRIQMAAQIAAQNKSTIQSYSAQQQADANQMTSMRKAHNKTIREANARLASQRSSFERQATEAKVAREKYAFAMDAVQNRKIKTAKRQTQREGIITPSVTGQSKKAAGSLLTARVNPSRRAVGGYSNKGKRRRGGTNTRRPR